MHGTLQACFFVLLFIYGSNACAGGRNLTLNLREQTALISLAALCQLSLHLPASELINPAKLPPPDNRTLISGRKYL